MKKTLFILFFLMFPVVVGAQTCPFGLENDPAPGSCGRFVDENVNALCDLSEVPLDVRDPFSSNSAEAEPEYVSGEELKKHTVFEVAQMYEIDARTYAQRISEFLKQDVKLDDSLQALHDEYNFCSGVAGGIALNLKNEKVQNVPLKKELKVEQAVVKGKNLYNLVPVILILIISYLFTYILVKEKKISLLTHRRIWNILLLVSFLISGILGLLLVIRINYGWSLNFPFNMLKIHVEAGIVMAVITMFHVAWHWRYFTIMFKRKNNIKLNEDK